MTISDYSLSIFRKVPLVCQDLKFRFILTLDFMGNETKFCLSLPPKSKKNGRNDKFDELFHKNLTRTAYARYA